MLQRFIAGGLSGPQLQSGRSWNSPAFAYPQGYLGPCIKDLAGVLDLIGERTDWDVAAASRVLDAYQDVRALQPGEQELMYALGTFPSRVWQVCCEYYKGRRNRSEPEAAEMLCREWENQIKRREYWQLLLGDVLGYENST